MMPRWIIYLLLALAALISAAGLGWWLGQPDPVVEKPAAEQRQADGSVVLERRPDAAAKPAQLVPQGAKVERVGRVTVQPPRIGDDLPANGRGFLGSSSDPCQPVTVDWSLVREPDGGRRMLASSPDGTIIGGVDVPIETAAPPPKPLRWAAGISWSPANETAGLWIERDVPLFSTAARVGLDLNQERALPGSSAGTDLRVRVGLAF
jgi:hypothetical protein